MQIMQIMHGKPPSFFLLQVFCNFVHDLHDLHDDIFKIMQIMQIMHGKPTSFCRNAPKPPFLSCKSCKSCTVNRHLFLGALTGREIFVVFGGCMICMIYMIIR